MYNTSNSFSASIDDIINTFNENYQSYIIDEWNTIRFKGPRFCKVCKWTHDSNGALIKYSAEGDWLMYICFSDPKNVQSIMQTTKIDPNVSEKTFLDQVC